MAYKHRMDEIDGSVRPPVTHAPDAAVPAGAPPRAPMLPLALLIAYAGIWTALAIAPRHRQDWLLENLVVAMAVPLLVLGFRRLRFSNASYIALFVFLVLPLKLNLMAAALIGAAVGIAMETLWPKSRPGA